MTVTDVDWSHDELGWQDRHPRLQTFESGRQLMRGTLHHGRGDAVCYSSYDHSDSVGKGRYLTLQNRSSSVRISELAFESAQQRISPSRLLVPIQSILSCSCCRRQFVNQNVKRHLNGEEKEGRRDRDA